MIEIEVYLIRHKATGKFMPQMRGKGYTHWNPNDPNKTKKLSKEMPVPRIIKDLRSAKIATANWFNMPNGRMTSQTDWESGYKEWDLDFRFDGRKREDLEIVKGRLIIDEST